uniref:Uncharacterized protein n=1 Tax=Anguilla anguilla TaxID=7936 RepID=A0A0E9S7T7_ANGAN
MLHLNRNGIIH